ncbi:hypothetical protein mRhiFer1_010113 [Rhinolophus ferrumequinum]|uniref:Secreted protein n=1 Tax=Rhinolophus ferrumequinum TaxID=59479 RepID=A0A7J7XPL3_RHIFE|nr:hypothetical protein mRhiFer1_010113 [Rhinolophus ferrumequinum]
MSITRILKMPVLTFCSLTFILEEWFSTGDVLPLPPMPGTLAIPRDIFGCHNWGKGCLQASSESSPGNAAKQPTVYRTVPSPCTQQRLIWSKMSVVLRLRNPVGEVVIPKMFCFAQVIFSSNF